MGTGPGNSQNQYIVVNPVNQQPVGLDVALTESGIIAR